MPWTVHGSIGASAAGGRRAQRGRLRRGCVGRRRCGCLAGGGGRRSPGRLRAAGRRRRSSSQRSTGKRRAGRRRRAGRARWRQPARSGERRGCGRRRRRRLDQRVAGQLARQQHAQHRELDQRLAAQRGRQRQAARQPVERWVIGLAAQHASAGVKNGDGRAGWRQARWKAAECVLPGSHLLGPSPPLSSASVQMPTARHIHGTPLSRRSHPSHRHAVIPYKRSQASPPSPPHAPSRCPGRCGAPGRAAHRAQLLPHDDCERLGARVTVLTQRVRLERAARRKRQVRRQQLAQRAALVHAPARAARRRRLCDL